MLPQNLIVGSFLAVLFFSVTWADIEDARSFLSLDPNGGLALTHLPDCSEDTDKNCTRVIAVDLDALVKSPFVSLPDGTVLERDPKENIVQPDGSIFCNFKGGNDTSADFAVVLVGDNLKTPHANGIVRRSDGRIEELEYCMGRCQDDNDHIWLTYNLGAWDGNDTVIEEGSNDDNSRSFLSNLDAAPMSRQGPIQISMFVYYTTAFKNAVPDVKGFIDQAIGETNTGLTNSKVNIRVTLHCYEEAVGLEESTNSSIMLVNFRNYKGTVPNLLRTADTGMLLVNDLGTQHCGIAYFNNPSLTIGVTAKACALGYFTFGHELFHNFGAGHNREAGGTPPATGYLIKNTPYRTVLALSHPDHPTRINYYSTSDATVRVNGQPVGEAGLSDNRLVMERSAVTYQNIGNETGACPANGPRDGGWTEWGSYSACSVSCGGIGYRYRYRTCTNPEPANGGKRCYGNRRDSVVCNMALCPIPLDGGWSDWGSCSPCSKSCGGGTRTRTRECINPTPFHGGKECSGSTTKIEQCNTQPCNGGPAPPINGSWSSLTHIPCNVPCGMGTEYWYRQCNDPQPSNGGHYCVGYFMAGRSCFVRGCPAVVWVGPTRGGGWAEWSGWGDCSKTCGGGFQTTERQCYYFGGSPCYGDNLFRRTCNTQPC